MHGLGNKRRGQHAAEEDQRLDANRQLRGERFQTDFIGPKRRGTSQLAWKSPILVGGGRQSPRIVALALAFL